MTRCRDPRIRSKTALFSKLHEELETSGLKRQKKRSSRPPASVWLQQAIWHMSCSCLVLNVLFFCLSSGLVMTHLWSAACLSPHVVLLFLLSVSHLVSFFLTHSNHLITKHVQVSDNSCLSVKGSRWDPDHTLRRRSAVIFSSLSFLLVNSIDLVFISGAKL